MTQHFARIAMRRSVTLQDCTLVIAINGRRQEMIGRLFRKKVRVPWRRVEVLAWHGTFERGGEVIEIGPFPSKRAAIDHALSNDAILDLADKAVVPMI